MQTLATALDWVVQVLGPGLELASTHTLDTRQVRGRRGQSRLPSEVGGATILITLLTPPRVGGNQTRSRVKFLHLFATPQVCEITEEYTVVYSSICLMLKLICSSSR